MASADRVVIVQNVATELARRGVNLSGPCGAFEITKRVAWLLRGEGWGLIRKPEGNNCDGYSVDCLIHLDRTVVDALIDAGGANTPAWNLKAELGDSASWRAPFDPGDMPAPAPAPVPPAPVPPAPSDPLADAIARFLPVADALITGADAIVAALASVDARLERLERDGIRVRLG